MTAAMKPSVGRSPSSFSTRSNSSSRDIGSSARCSISRLSSISWTSACAGWPRGMSSRVVADDDRQRQATADAQQILDDQLCVPGSLCSRSSTMRHSWPVPARRTSVPSRLSRTRAPRWSGAVRVGSSTAPSSTRRGARSPESAGRCRARRCRRRPSAARRRACRGSRPGLARSRRRARRSAARSNGHGRRPSRAHQKAGLPARRADCDTPTPSGPAMATRVGSPSPARCRADPNTANSRSRPMNAIAPKHSGGLVDTGHVRDGFERSSHARIGASRQRAQRPDAAKSGSTSPSHSGRRPIRPSWATRRARHMAPTSRRG